MKKIGFILIIISFLSVIFISQLRLINQPVQDYDEGVYLTTFLLISSGHPAYKETFLSQPPGFLISVYPGFVLLGKSLQAARLTVGIWSLIGLLAIIWICSELKKRWAGIFALGVLYLSPYYYNQTLVFHSDILVGTFSLIALASIFRYINTKHLRWFFLTALFLNLTFWTKFDFFLIPSLLIVFILLIKNKQLDISNIKKLISIFVVVSISFFLIFIMPFGIQYVLSNTIGLRFSAVNLQAAQPLLFLTYIRQDPLILLLTIGAIILTIFKKDNLRFPKLPFLIWVSTIFVFFLFYKPLFIHHMVIYTIPLVLYFSLSITSGFKKQSSFYPLVISGFMLLALLSYLSITLDKTVGLLSPDQQTAVKIIDKNSNQKDTIVTDEGILNWASNRLPPPQLVDVSYVRISSQNLSSEKFKQIIQKSKPKLIIPWNGRLRSVEGFSDVLKSYKLLTTINKKTIYIRTDL
jgi:4-amino-4-deoxy-L-arabinose transferase-like glycosyltransferase